MRQNSCIIESGRGADRGIDGANLTYQLRSNLLTASYQGNEAVAKLPPDYPHRLRST